MWSVLRDLAVLMQTVLWLDLMLATDGLDKTWKVDSILHYLLYTQVALYKEESVIAPLI